MTATRTTIDRRLAVAAIGAGVIEMGFSLILGVGGLVLLPLLGAASLVLGVVALQRASHGSPARGIAILGVFAAVLGVGAVVLLLWFLSHIRFTF